MLFVWKGLAFVHWPFKQQPSENGDVRGRENTPNGEPVVCADCYDPIDTYKQLRCIDRYSGVSSSLVFNGIVDLVMFGLIVHSVGGNQT